MDKENTKSQITENLAHVDYESGRCQSMKEHLENGKAISPQFPMLIIVDIFYAHFLQSDRLRKEELHNNTINALYKE